LPIAGWRFRIEETKNKKQKTKSKKQKAKSNQQLK